MTTNNYQDALAMFSKQVVAIYKANRLLESHKDNNFLTENEIYEIKRELACSRIMANFYFSELEQLGIPENQLSLHLQVA